MKTFWKLYYKWKFKDQYESIINKAKLLQWHVEDSSCGDLSHFYDMKGEQIRGWYKKSPSFKYDNKHPMVTYYENR